MRKQGKKLGSKSSELDGGKREALILPIAGKGRNPEASVKPAIVGYIGKAVLVKVRQTLPEKKFQRPVLNRNHKEKKGERDLRTGRRK